MYDLQMGLNIQAIKLLYNENLHKKIAGNVLLIGKSTVTVSRENLDLFFKNNEIELSSKDFTKFDTNTKRSSSIFNIDDVELLYKLFPQIEKIDVLDISSFEGANVIADLNNPINEKLKFNYDFIYDSSVLDNVFNPAQMITNVAQMLKPFGRVLMVNVASFFPGAMVSCHPEWFYSFFAINNFSDVKIYLAVQEKHDLDQFQYKSNLWLYQPYFTPKEKYNYLEAVMSTSGVAYVYAFAELGSNLCSNINFPVNMQYIDSSESEDWRKKQNDYALSKRAIINANLSIKNAQNKSRLTLPHNTDHYIYVGEDF